MTKLSRKIIDPKEMGNFINNLWSAFILMDTKDDIRLLFKDLFSHTEYKMFAKRLEISRMLLTGYDYEEIEERVKVTSTTIAKVSNLLSEKGDGLRKAHEKLNEIEKAILERQKQKQKDLENPFGKRLRYRQKTVLGTAIKAGLKAIDRKIVKRAKKQSAEKQLII